MIVPLILGVSGCLACIDLPPAAVTFIQNTLKVSDFRSATADLDDDGKAEIFVYSQDRGRCGSGGCNLYVISPDAGTYRVVMRSTITQLPIRLLPTRSHGWRDIGVTVSGGGITRPYTARMRFDGMRYPSNPTVPPAIPLSKPSGSTLIGR